MSAMEFGNAVNSEAFAKMLFIVYASIELIIAALSLYTFTYIMGFVVFAKNKRIL
jgi:hypothetical protein